MAKRIRELYLRAVLRQDIAFFDNVGAGEVATRIQTDTRMLIFLLPPSCLTHTPIDLVQQGTSEKVARKSLSPPKGARNTIYLIFF